MKTTSKPRVIRYTFDGYIRILENDGIAEGTRIRGWNRGSEFVLEASDSEVKTIRRSSSPILRTYRRTGRELELQSEVGVGGPEAAKYRAMLGVN